jgi:hypothetical protein
VLPVNPLDKLTNMGGSVLCRDIGASIVCFVRVRPNISRGVCRDIKLDFGWIVSSAARRFGRFLSLGAGSIKASGLKTRATLMQMRSLTDRKRARCEGAGSGARLARVNSRLSLVFIAHSRIACRAFRYKWWGMWIRGLSFELERRRAGGTPAGQEADRATGLRRQFRNFRPLLLIVREVGRTGGARLDSSLRRRRNTCRCATRTPDCSPGWSELAASRRVWNLRARRTR